MPPGPLERISEIAGQIDRVSGPIFTIVSDVWQKATIRAYHPSVSTCLGQAAVSAVEDLTGASMLPGSHQDNWTWSSDKFGFVYTGAAEDESMVGASTGVDAVEQTADFIENNSWVQAEIRQFARREGYKISVKAVSKDAAMLGKWAGRLGKIAAADSANQRYQKCRGK